MPTRTNGVDCFIVMPPETKDSMSCKACGSECNVQRNQYGPTSFGAAMAGISNRHDVFTCPYSGEEWHQKAIRLLGEMEATASDGIRTIIRQDMEALVREHLKIKRDVAALSRRLMEKRR